MYAHLLHPHPRWLCYCQLITVDTAKHLSDKTPHSHTHTQASAHACSPHSHTFGCHKHAMDWTRHWHRNGTEQRSHGWSELIFERAAFFPRRLHLTERQKAAGCHFLCSPQGDSVTQHRNGDPHTLTDIQTCTHIHTLTHSLTHRPLPKTV